MKKNSNNKQNNSKNRRLIIIFIILILLFLLLAGCLQKDFLKGGFLSRGSQKDTEGSTQLKNTNSSQDTANEDSESSSEELTPEEAIRRLEESEEVKVTGPMTAEITSPKEEEFLQSQARLYKAEITNFPKNARGSCEWLFYLNQYDEEELYEQMTTPVIQDSCKFTSTFISNRGELRVEVKITAVDPSDEEIVAETVSEREYLVK